MKKMMFMTVVGFFVMACIAVACIYNTYQKANMYLTLVNKQNKLPEDWTEKILLVKDSNYHGESFMIEHETMHAFKELRSNLLSWGVDIELDSVYRSVEEQQEIWDEWSADPELGEDYCKQYLAVPGYSEHHTGLAVDVFLVKDGKDIRDNDEMLAEKEEFAKLHEILADYGFILRYPEGKEDITGYAYEPWHFRYIGNADIARKIMEDGITLEEYLQESGLGAR